MSCPIPIVEAMYSPAIIPASPKLNPRRSPLVMYGIAEGIKIFLRSCILENPRDLLSVTYSLGTCFAPAEQFSSTANSPTTTPKMTLDAMPRPKIR